MEKMLLNRLNGEMKKINEGLPQGVPLILAFLLSLAPVEGENGPNLMKWRGAIEGPVGSSYEGGLFNLDIIIPDDYPLSPPKVTMLTKIYHPNISSSGYICISILKRRSDDGQWVSGTTLPMLMVALQSLLSDPNPGKGNSNILWRTRVDQNKQRRMFHEQPEKYFLALWEMKNKPDEYKRYATAWTKRYAIKRTM
ncbi:hypothetical protein FOCC_FOCC014082 [Frankliniella occidentalis]|nr:hypothetical protein FOCC_FOCC014082 [Frankliniella occidentalis]